MALNILQLLGSQVRTPADGLTQADVGDTGVSPDIIVTPPPPLTPRDLSVGPSYEAAAPRPDITPEYILNDARMAPHASEMEEILPRRGRFGVSGTLRDILGTVGDAFLISSGRDPIYSNRREQERAADAMYGVTQDPLQAVERLAAAGYTREAQALLQQVQGQQQAQAALQSQEAARASQIEDRRHDNYMKARTAIGQLFNSEAARNNPDLAFQQAQRIANAAGVPIEEFFGKGVDQLSPELIDMFSAGAMTVNQNIQADLRERQLNQQREIAEMNEEGRNRRYNPPRPAQPRAQTPLEYFQEVSKIPANQRTAEQQAWINDYTGQNKRGSRSGRSSSLPAMGQAPNSGGFRVRSVRPAN